MEILNFFSKLSGLPDLTTLIAAQFLGQNGTYEHHKKIFENSIHRKKRSASVVLKSVTARGMNKIVKIRRITKARSDIETNFQGCRTPLNSHSNNKSAAESPG